jgi:GNAT superfamily N-acetyltransferase
MQSMFFPYTKVDKKNETNGGIHLQFVEKQGLTEQELADIRKLEERCNREEGIRLKLNWMTLQTRPAGETNDFLAYESGELVGFLGLYCFHSTEAEISGMVHPDYRRRGVFTSLVQAVKEECRRRGVPKLIFICQHRSVSGKAFLQALGAEYAFSEHWMEMTWADPREEQVQGREEEKPESELVRRNEQHSCREDAERGALRLHKATIDDLDIIVDLVSQGFEMSPEDSLDFVKRTLNDETEATYLSERDGEIIGNIRVSLEEGGAFLYGFCMRPDVRGHGYGRQTLAAIIDLVRREHGVRRFLLEVETKNDRALGLYESCGFRSQNVNDYYTLLI